jgi:hypothetical protein
LNVKGDIEARVRGVVPEAAGALALIGENRKLPIIPLEGVPSITRGRGKAAAEGVFAGQPVSLGKVVPVLPSRRRP